MSFPILFNQISENFILNLLQGIQLFHKFSIPYNYSYSFGLKCFRPYLKKLSIILMVHLVLYFRQKATAKRFSKSVILIQN